MLTQQAKIPTFFLLSVGIFAFAGFVSGLGRGVICAAALRFAAQNRKSFPVFLIFFRLTNSVKIDMIILLICGFHTLSNIEGGEVP